MHENPTIIIGIYIDLCPRSPLDIIISAFNIWYVSYNDCSSVNYTLYISYRTIERTFWIIDSMCIVLSNFNSRACLQSQKVKNTLHEDMMPLYPILIVEIFDLWAIDFMAAFLNLLSTRTCDHKIMLKFLKSLIFCRFGCPCAITIDNSFHFINTQFRALMKNIKLHIKYPCHIMLNQMYKEKCPTEKSRKYFKNSFNWIEMIGHWKLMMLNGWLEQHIKLLLICHNLGGFLTKHVICRTRTQDMGNEILFIKSWKP